MPSLRELPGTVAREQRAVCEECAFRLEDPNAALSEGRKHAIQSGHRVRIRQVREATVRRV